MSDDDDDDDDGDLFASSDSDDTAELLQAAAAAKKTSTSGSNAGPAATSRLKKKSTTAASAPPKKSVPKKVVAVKKNKAAKKAASSGSSDEGGGLFDSDSSDDDSSDDDDDEKKPAASAEEKKPLSKRERLEALAKSRRKDAPTSSSSASKKNKDSKKDNKSGGYDSGDSYDSGGFERTQDDDDFLDVTGEDQDAVQELYAEQHFDDERPDDGGPKKKKRKIRNDDNDNRRGGDDGIDTTTGTAEPDNPIMAAVHRMKKVKREKKTFSELEEEAKVFLGKMEWAADQDEQSVAERKPALQKLALLSTVCETLARRDLQRMLLDLELLSVCKRWIQPLPNGQLGNVTVRQRVLEAIGNMNHPETGIQPNDLKQSGLGKVVMLLYKHKSETPAMKQQLKKLIENWSRPIFQKSGNMRDLQYVQRGTEYGLSALSRQHQQVRSAATAAAATAATKEKNSSSNQHSNLQHLIAGGKKASGEGSSGTRVRVPFSKGFHYSVRPEGRGPGAAAAAVAANDPDSRGDPGEAMEDKRRAPGTAAAAVADTRGKLSRRMVEKGRKTGKNQRSANISIEGRRTKG